MSDFQIFSPAARDLARDSGKVLRACLQEVRKHVQPGISTKELDDLAEKFICDHHGAVPAFKGYNNYPATLCISINEEAVHGIPSASRILKDGDIVSLDGGVIFGGVYTDACITVPVGNVSSETLKFLDVTEKALEKACGMVKPGEHVGDVSFAIESSVVKAGYHCLKALTGHGLGDTLHQFPDIPNVGRAGTGPIIPPWTLLAIEPITCMGTSDIKEGDDGWTIKSADGSLTCHFEHTILVTEKGMEILA